MKTLNLVQMNKWLCVLAFVCCGLSINAQAQTPAPTKRQKAIKNYKEAQNAFSLGENDKAAKLYLKAYSYLPKALFLFNAANAYEKDKAYASALKLAKQAQAEKNMPLNAVNRKKNAALIRNLESVVADLRRADGFVKNAKIAKANAKNKEAIKLYLDAYGVVAKAEYLHEAAKIAQSQGDFERALSLAKQARGKTNFPLDARLAAENNTLIEELKAEKARWRYTRTDWRTYVGGTSAGIGAVMMVVGLGYFGNKARTDIDNLNQDQSEDEYNKKVTEIERTQAQGLTVFGVGTALTVVGLGLVFWDLSNVEKTRSSTKVVVLPTQDGGVASVMWRW